MREILCWVVVCFFCFLPLTAEATLHLATPANPQNEESVWRKAEQQRLQTLSDKELLALFSATKVESSWYEKKINTEMLLTEMIRRGGQSFEKAIIEKMQAQRKALQDQEARERQKDDDKEKGAQVKPVHREYLSPENLPLLTALRRIQKKPEPVAIMVKQLGTVSTTRELPCFSVEIKNVDVEKQPFHFSFGGDYRSGRMARCAFEVRDAKGTLLPPRHWEAMMGGGMFTMGDLDYGKTWDTELPLGSYVKITEPGEYTVRVLYHNSLTIADYADLTGVIACVSEPFKVTVGKPVPRKVFVRTGSVEKVASLVQDLKGKSTVRTVCSKYDQDLYSFIDPTSPEGQLLLMEWSAVPGLLELLKEKNLTKEQRAWIFVMLHTFTHADDMNPFVHNVTSRFTHQDGVIGSYTYRGVGCYGSGGGIINPDVQQKFAEEWLKLAPELWEFVVADEATLKDLGRLEGDWSMVSSIDNGVKGNVEARSRSQNGETTVHYYHREEQERTLFPSRQLHLKAKYLIDGSKKTIDYDITQGVNQGKEQLGIYKIEGDTVTFCFATPGKDRPDDFTSKPGSERTLSVWRRDK